jgi:hypothetical protein
MILWTIQTENAWREFLSSGVLRSTRERIMEQEWDSPYKWMIRQMEQRIGPPPTPGAFPVWAWLQWENAKRPKPDLRAGGLLLKCESGVRIEFECPDSLALLSDFDLWHFVLNYWYLPESEVEGDEFEAQLAERGFSFFETKPLPNRVYHDTIVASWDKIFDLDWSESEIAMPRSEKSIQATVWELNADQVRNHDYFMAR